MEKSIRDCKSHEDKTELVKETFLALGFKVCNDYNYNGAKDKVPFVIIDKNNEFYGYKGNLIWNNVKSGQKIDIKCLFNEERDMFIKTIYNKIGLQPLEKYKRNNDAILVKIIDEESEYFGYIGKISPSNVRNGQNWDSRSLLRSEWERYIRNFCNDLDYEVINYPKTIYDKITVKTRKGNIWTPLWRDIKRGSRCPLDTKISFGERCLNELFKLNNIEFEYQKNIRHEDGTWQRMDFFIPKYNLCIEYNGEQHYKEYGNNFKNDFEETSKMDAKKKLYCEDNKIDFLEIPYTVNNIFSITEIVSTKLSINLEKPKDIDVQYSSLYDDDVIIKLYHKLKSVHKVANLLNISSTPVHNVLKRHSVETYRNNVKIVQLTLNGEFIKEWQNVSRAKEYLNTTANIYDACKGILKTSCGFKWMYKEDYEKYITNLK